MNRQFASTPTSGPSEQGCAESAAFFAPLREAPPSPRTRAARAGLDSLSNRELLSAILASHDETNAEAGAGALCARYESLERLLGADLSQLAACAGPEAALTIKLAHELSCRAAREPLLKREVLSSWSALIAYLRARIAGRGREVVRVLYLDKRNCLITDEALGEGTADWAPIRPQVVIRRALELDATFLIVAHVHPSSDVTPSQADITVTRELDAAAKAIGLGLHDHVIVGQGGEAVSFRQKGLL